MNNVSLYHPQPSHVQFSPPEAATVALVRAFSWRSSVCALAYWNLCASPEMSYKATHTLCVILQFTLFLPSSILLWFYISIYSPSPFF